MLERLRGRTSSEIKDLSGVRQSNLSRWVALYGKALAKEHGLPFPPPKGENIKLGQPFRSGVAPSPAFLALVGGGDEPVGSSGGPSAAASSQLPLSMTTLDASLIEQLEPKYAVADASSYRASLKLDVIRAMLDGKETVIEIARRFGVTYQSVYAWYKTHGPTVAVKLGLPFRPLRLGKRQEHNEAEGNSTRLSRPSPPSNGPPPSRNQNAIVAYAEQNAETARLESRIEFLENSLRRALRERDAFEVVLELEQAKKNANAPPSGDY